MYNERKLRAMIIDDFECLKTDVDSLIDYYKAEAKRCIDENCREDMHLALDKWESLCRYKQKIEEILDEFDSLFVEQVEEQEQSQEDEEFVGLQNFTFAEPLQIKLLNNYYDVNRNWREVLITVCEELIKKHPEKFSTFDKNSVFKGRKRSYFSYNPKELTENNRKLSNGLYVEMNLSANSIARICYNILEQCGYNSDELKFKIEYKQQEPEKNYKIKTAGKDSEIKLPPKYSSVHIAKELFQKIIDEIISSIKDNESGVFNPPKISEKLKDIIVSESDYAVPYHVVNKITNYLVDCKLVEKVSNGKYAIRDLHTLKSWMGNI